MILLIDIILSAASLAFGYYAVCCYFNDKKLKDRDFGILKLTKNKIMYLCAGASAAVLLIAVLQGVYQTEEITKVKLLLLIFIILPVSAIDLRLNKIPNGFMLFALVLRGVIYAAEFIISPDDFLPGLVDDAIGAAVLGGFFLLLLLVFKNSIGMGDVKLFAVIGLYQGLWGALNSTFYSLAAAFVMSVFLLITGKKTRKDTISFGPSILIGTVAAICISGM